MRIRDEDLTGLKTRLHREIDEAADRKRAEFITLDPGMVGVYVLKKGEAEMVMANTTYDGLAGEYVTHPSLSQWVVPNVYAEAADLDLTLYGASIVILTKATEWAFVASIIESLRLSHKRAVTAATTTAECNAAAIVDWSPVPTP